jgi:diamine N-acetyltransferase
MIQGNQIYLRPIHLEDAPVVLEWENNPELWKVTEAPGPFVLSEIENFIKNSNDLFEHGQMRWIICDKMTQRTIGALDLFDYSAYQKTTGIGILIAHPLDRKKGAANEALSLLIPVLRNTFRVEKIHCMIHTDNIASIRLFEKNGFVRTNETSFKEKSAFHFERFTT